MSANSSLPPSIPTAPPRTGHRPSAVPDGSTTGCDKFLVGCGLGCGVLLILGIVAAMAIGLWVFRPGPQHETTAAVSDDSVATIHLKDVGEDAGTQELITHAMVTFNEANRQIRRENLPENMRWLSDLGNQNTSPTGMNLLFPRDLTISFEERDADELAAKENRGPGDELAVVGAVNFRSFVRPVRFIFEWAAARDHDARVRPHGEHQLLGLEANAWICFVDGTLYFSGSPSALEAALDRLDRGDLNRQWQAELPEGDWDVSGAMKEGSQMIGELVAWSFDPGASLRRLEELEAELEAKKETRTDTGADTGTEAQTDRKTEPRLDERLGDPEEVVGALTFGGNIRSADAVSLVFHLELASAEWAERYAEVLRETWERRSAQAAEEGLELEWQVEVEGSRVVGDVDLTGLETWIERMADRLVTTSREAQSAPDDPSG